MKHAFITLLLVASLAACGSESAARDCSPLVVEGKLIIDGTLIVPSCGIVIGKYSDAQPNTDRGAQ